LQGSEETFPLAYGTPDSANLRTGFIRMWGNHLMKKNIFAGVIFAGLLLCGGCNSPNDPDANGLSVNQASFTFNETKYVISIFTNWSGYNADELVIRGYDNGLGNTLMMTFKPIPGDLATIDTDMTGFWELGVCIPINRYLLSGDANNYIRVTSYDPASKVITGEFSLTFRYEKNVSKVASFSDGAFKAKIDTTYAFTYCREG
jgi:hypothetical protein